MRGFGGFLTFLIIFKLYNGGLERWAKIPHVSNAETVRGNSLKNVQDKIFMKKLLILSLLIISVRTFAQVDRINLTNEILVLFDTSRTEIHCKVLNDTEFKYLVWISRNEKSNLTNKELTHEHFLENKGDFSLYNIATESEMNFDSLSLNDCELFTKVIYPLDSLIITLKTEKGNSSIELANFKEFINKKLVILKENELERIKSSDLNRILFKGNEYFVDRKCLEL